MENASFTTKLKNDEKKQQYEVEVRNFYKAIIITMRKIIETMLIQIKALKLNARQIKIKKRTVAVIEISISQPGLFKVVK